MRNHPALLSIWAALVGVLTGVVSLAAVPLQAARGAEPAIVDPDQPIETVGDRLYLWGHRAGVYNDNFLKKLKPSMIEPVAAADFMGLRNMYFVRFPGDAPPPFADYYRPFKKLDRVVWSLTGANGRTSAEERDAAFQLAADNSNLTGFIMDDFFHLPVFGSPRPAQWLAENRVTFPVVVTLTSPAAQTLGSLSVGQSNWPTGDYRTKDIALESTTDGQTWRPIKQFTLPNSPGAEVLVELPGEPVKGLRLKILSTHDTAGAISCGLSSLSWPGDGGGLERWKVAATSTFQGFSADALLESGAALPASLSPAELRDLEARLVVGGRRLPLQAVIYTAQIVPRAKRHLQYVDEVTLWTWRPEDLDQLDDNLTKLERLVPGKPVVLGCYLFDFHASKPLTVERMKQQIDLGYRWLRQGRVAGMIFLGSPICDLDLEAVAFSKRWIAEHKDQPLAAPTAN